MNALKHGLRAQRFELLPHETVAEGDAFFSEVRRCYGATDAVERGLVEGIAAAMWRLIRADRLEAEAMGDIHPSREGRMHGSALVGRPEHRASLTTMLRYRAQAQMELQRATKMLEAYRKQRAAFPPPDEADHDEEQDPTPRAEPAVCDEVPAEAEPSPADDPSAVDPPEPVPRQDDRCEPDDREKYTNELSPEPPQECEAVNGAASSAGDDEKYTNELSAAERRGETPAAANDDGPDATAEVPDPAAPEPEPAPGETSERWFEEYYRLKAVQRRAEARRRAYGM